MPFYRDALSVEERWHVINYVKKEFGKKFHTHLYTSLVLVDEKSLKKLYDSGLDEIRFHPDLENKKYWGRTSLFKKFKSSFLTSLKFEKNAGNIFDVFAFLSSILIKLLSIAIL